jgi:pyridoxine 5'-phosphate synthase PdxJ
VAAYQCGIRARRNFHMPVPVEAGLTSPKNAAPQTTTHGRPRRNADIVD